MRNWLTEKRVGYGMTKTTLADLAGVHVSAIGKYEQGLRTPRMATARRIAVVLAFDWTRFYEEARQ